MEFLVTMTTTVPEGTSDAEVDEIRGREAANTARLATEGKVLRLWRPPLKPGEWRSIGLFAADDPDALERTLASMPLRAWRRDEVTPLGVHPNDPGAGQVALDAGAEEFLVTLVVDPDAAAVDGLAAREAARARELAGQGHLRRLWTRPGPGRSLGLWQAAGPDRMAEILRSLPMADWLTTETVPLTRHPSDPAVA